MRDRNRSPVADLTDRRGHGGGEEGGGGDRVKKLQACSATVIADCVAMCCCPCAVVNIVILAFVKLPWAAARKLLKSCRRKKNRRRIGRGTAEDQAPENVQSSSVAGIGEQELNYNFSTELCGEDVWLELYEVGHLGFGRVSFTEFTLQ